MRGNMVLADVRKSQLETLDYFAGICEKNALRYSLAGGTLLGAIRHKGYIPWDDDIDVMMPRPDYIKFMALRNTFETERFKLLTPYEKANHLPFYFLKFCDKKTNLVEMPSTKKLTYHVYIDIFPVDGLPEDIHKSDKKFDAFWHLIMKHAFFSRARYNASYGNVFRRLAWSCVFILSLIIRPQRIAKKIDAVGLQDDFDSCEFAGVLCGKGKCERIHRNGFATKKLPFEDRFYSCIENYDEYLTGLYGDYMTLPPKEKQVLAHDYAANLAESV